MMAFFRTILIASVFLVTCPWLVGGACDYTSLSTSMNACTGNASGTTNTRWMFPFGTISQQATFCSGLVALETCLNNTFYSCRADAKSLKMFDVRALNLVNAYSALCSDTLINEAQACMSVISSINTFTTAETSFASSVSALNDAASNTEICGLALTLQFTAYTSLLSVTCTTSTHLAVWTSFYDTVLNTYLCATCSATQILCSISLFAVILFNFSTYVVF